MADTEQPTPEEQSSSPPRAYVNFAHGHGAALEFGLTVGYREGEANPVVIQPLVMSWEFVPILIQLLQSQLEAYQDQMGTVRDVKGVKIEGAP